MQNVHYPHPALRPKAESLTAITAQVHADAAEMLRLMYEHHGIGVAANQVDLPCRIVVLNVTVDPKAKDLEQILITSVNESSRSPDRFPLWLLLPVHQCR